MDNAKLLNIKNSPSEEYREVDYSYRDRKTCRVPIEITDTEDEELIAEWIKKWIDDADDLEIVSF